ncbi:MAG: cohesin domain-containing protein [bacterium]|nr:cohesin domain-containing protein [bacterium]
MYLSSPSSSVARDSTLTVGIHVNSGEAAINAVQANLSYSSDKLDFVSISPSLVFPVESENSGGNGVVHVGRGTFGSVKGDQLIANVTFKAKAAGLAEVNFAASSSATESSNNKVVSVSTAGSQYTVTDESSTAQSGTSHDVIPPKISDVKVVDINYKSLKLTWKTSEPSQSEISYGSTEAYGVAAVDTNFVTDHLVELASEALTPATSYHYKITNKDTAGNTTSTADQTFTTKGAVITLKVIGSNQQAVKGATVTVDNSITQKTDKNGLATFSNLAAGDHTLVATKNGKSSTTTVSVTIPQNNPSYVSLQIDIRPLSPLKILLIVIVLAALALAITKQLKKNKKSTPGASEPEDPTEHQHHHKAKKP